MITTPQFDNALREAIEKIIDDWLQDVVQSYDMIGKYLNDEVAMDEEWYAVSQPLIKLFTQHTTKTLKALLGEMPKKLDGSRLTEEEFMESKAGVLVRAHNAIETITALVEDKIKELRI